MTDVRVTVDPLGAAGGPWDISNYVVEADIWRETLSGVGRFEVDLVNGDGVGVVNPYGGVFATDMRVRIEFDVGAGWVVMLAGYIDDVNNYLDTRGYYTQMMKIKGRDHGMDLAQHYITADYQIQAADNIVQAALGVIPSEINYVSPGVAPNIAYNFDRTYLSDGIREIAEYINYDLYVTDAIPPVLTFFSIAAAAATGVNLLMDVAGATNNILLFDYGEQLGYDIKNYIDIHMGGVKDHWTDENAEPAVPPPYGWVAREADGLTVVNNVRAPPPPFAPLEGRSVIEWERTTLGGGAGASTHTMGIDFSAAAGPWTNVSDYYGYAGGSIDLSERSDCRVMMRTDAGGLLVVIRPILFDNAGNVIWFYSLYGNPVPPTDDDRKGYGPTDDLQMHPLYPNWFRLKFPVGDDLQVAGVLTESMWSHVGAPVGPIPASAGGVFNWNNVQQIWFGSINNQNPCNFWIDDLTIPAVEARYLSSNAASIAAYGQRMYHEYRGDLGSQVQAVQLGENLLEKREDPLETIRLTCAGQTGIIYPGLLVNVRAPSHGIGVLTSYRIMKLHHNVAVSPKRAKVEGYDYITELDLILQQTAGTDIPYDPMRMAMNFNPDVGQFQNLSRYNRRLMTSRWAREK